MILVQFNFDFPCAQMGDNLVKAAKELAESINQEPGFISKIWIENTQTAESGGIYLFEDLASAKQYAQMHEVRIKAMGVKKLSVRYSPSMKLCQKLIMVLYEIDTNKNTQASIDLKSNH